MSAIALANTGSFRDPTGKVYELEYQGDGLVSRRILRGVDKETLEDHKSLLALPFFNSLVQSGKVVKTDIVSDEDDSGIKQILGDGWSGVIEHEEIPFVSYPYEWSFSMLREAALLHLEILEISLENGWILKDLSLIHI